MKGEGDDPVRFQNLANAARVFIAERGEAIGRNEWGMVAPEDTASAQREHDAIEAEIGRLETLFAACREVARMKHPSVEHLLRHRGFGFEADRVAELVMAIDAIDTTVPE